MCKAFPGGFAPSQQRAGRGRQRLRRAGEVGRPRHLDARGRAAVPPLLDPGDGRAGRRRSAATAAGAGLEDAVRRRATRSTPRAASTSRKPHGAQAFGDALTDLAGAGIPVDAPLGQLPGRRPPRRHPDRLPRRPGALGVFNALAAPWDATTGYVGSWRTARRSSRSCRSTATAARTRGRS